MSLLQKAVGAVLRLMPDKAPDPLIGSGGAVGQPVSRVDGPLKVTGKARFAAEVPFENLAFAAVVYSTIARGSIASIDTAEAEAAAGVLLAMTYKNAPRLKAPLMMVADAKGAAGSNLPVMQDAKVRWNGEPVACIVAETQEQADDAAALVRVTYAAEPATTSFEAAKAKSAMRRPLSQRRRSAWIGHTRRRATTIVRSSCTPSPWPGRATNCSCTTRHRCCT
jgi:xanthine dehydrogenase YagR molybdenum-binding subunit